MIAEAAKKLWVLFFVAHSSGDLRWERRKKWSISSCGNNCDVGDESRFI